MVNERWSPDRLGRALWGRSLRFLLLDELRQRGQMTVAEMVVVLSEQGFHVEGRPSKVISDALRWEVRAGRVARVCRGVYRFVGMSRSRRRRVTLFAATCRNWITAAGQGLAPPPPRPGKTSAPISAHPLEPPWHHLGWLWLR